ncbi:uncharacterized protein LOC128552798 [Mercenaria mercenaria]|uniref:uncharacterized protein LOC128552798 n=1 Tax=Mercenaria mercenaria TaxID=6596 RepID=UPI00234F5AC0|nr:uncharacterized protein LOC128552798 [Mercenaria mercenaria]
MHILLFIAVDMQTELNKNENPNCTYGEDHYDLINENEIDSTVLLKDDRVLSRRLPSLPKPTNDDKEYELMVPSKCSATKYISAKEEEKSRCLEICEMVNIFKPLIVQNLLIRDILPSLPFLENHDDIYEESKIHSNKSAVASLLDELERSEELGKWEKFIDALIANGYTYIVDNIRGYNFISHRYQKEYIKSLTEKLGKMIKICELLPHLFAKDLISDTDKENIQQEDKNNGNIVAVYLLLDRIHRKHRNWYILFIEALKDAHMDDAAADLQIPELLKSKRIKVTDVCKFY